MCKTLYLENRSQLGPSNLASLPSAPIHRHGHDVTDSLSLTHVAGLMNVPEGAISLEEMASFARSKYPNDVTLAAWTWSVLLQDRTFFALHSPESDAAGRPFVLDVWHAVTHQTREEWMDSSKDTNLLRKADLWLIGSESLRSQYHRLYVHQVRNDGSIDNYCHDNQGHHRYVSSHGHSSDMRHIDPDTLDRQADEQGLNPCIYSFLHEWMLTRA